MLSDDSEPNKPRAPKMSDSLKVRRFKEWRKLKNAEGDLAWAADERKAEQKEKIEERALLTASPEEIRQYLTANRLRETREEFETGKEKGAIFKARGSEIKLYEQAQDVIDALAAPFIDLLPEDEKTHEKIIPQLYIHRSNISKGYTASATFPDVIEINSDFVKELKTNPKLFRAIMAHELAHMINGDSSIEGMIRHARRKRSYKMETLADRMGSIVYGGNITEYVEAIMSQGTIAPIPGMHFTNEGMQAHMKEWAAFLEKEGAVKNGVMDKEKALKAFEKAKFIAWKIPDHLIGEDTDKGKRPDHHIR